MIVSDSVKYIGVDDTDIDLFESQYLVPDGVSYNSYVILDDKIAVMDTVDERKTDEWFSNLTEVLEDRQPDYLVISHLEPDHSSNIERLAVRYPDMKLVGNAKTFQMLPQFFDMDFSERSIVVKEGEELSLGTHKLVFYMAPMVHWPEVMVTYEATEKILFSADGFGKFGAIELTKDKDWACEARRYYFNIAGKYGVPVQQFLKKAAGLDINMICPLHGPVLKDNLGYYIGLYDTWSRYEPENKGVLIAYASIHGNTAKAAYELADMLKKAGEDKVVVSDLSREDMAEAVEDAFRYGKLVLASITYNGEAFPFMRTFIENLTERNYQNRTIGLIENGSWAPTAAKVMKGMFEKSKNITWLENNVKIMSSLSDENVAEIDAMAEELCK